MKKTLLNTALLLLLGGNLTPSSYAQQTTLGTSPDTVPQNRIKVTTREYLPLVETKPLTALLGVGTPLVLFDFTHYMQDRDIRRMRYYYADGYRVHYDDVLMFAPLATAWGMRLAGAGGRSETLLETFTAQAMTIGVESAVVFGGKKITHRRRPDSSGPNSFPSGHTAFAFASAAILDAEYGAEYPWISALGYTAATATGIGRILNNRHWTTDVLTGAGVGLGSAYLGYYLSDLIFHGGNPRRDETLSADGDSRIFSVDKGFQTFLSGVGDYSASRVGLSTGLTVRVPLYRGWGIRAQGLLLESHDNDKDESLHGFLLMGKMDYLHALFGGRLLLDANVGLGYGSEMRLTDGDAEPYETAVPFVTRSLPISMGIGTTVSLMEHFGMRLGADYLYAFNARPYSRDTKKALQGFCLTLSMCYLLPR